MENLPLNNIDESEYYVTRTDIINRFIEKYNFKSYLEIGTGVRTDNFELINCPFKICIDPCEAVETSPDFKMTSDEFFKVTNLKFDIIFIDGLHEAHQVYKDILNSLDHLNKNGVIICHDCMPEDELTQKEYESFEGDETWNGDCWKAFMKYRNLSDYLCYTIRTDHGCGVIDTNKPSDISYTRMNINLNELCFSTYMANMHLMNFKDDIVE